MAEMGVDRSVARGPSRVLTWSYRRGRHATSDGKKSSNGRGARMRRTARLVRADAVGLPDGAHPGVSFYTRGRRQHEE